MPRGPPWAQRHAWLRCLRGHPHGSAIYFASFCPIIHIDPVNALFWNLVSGWKNLKMLPLFSCGRRICIRQWHHRPTPRPLAFGLLTLQHLITTTTMADYMLVFMPQKILSLSGLLGQNIMLLGHFTEWKRFVDNQLAIFVFFLLCSVFPSTVFVYSVQALCACSVSSLPFLVNFKHHL